MNSIRLARYSFVRSWRREGDLAVKSFCGHTGRGYHSFPDPNEKPQISSTTSSTKRQLDKRGAKYTVDAKFRLDTPFPGIPIGKALTPQDQPKTFSTKLSNGLTVASQDNLGLMSSFAFLVSRGSSYEIQHGSDNDTGATHLLELLAFRSTTNRSHQDLMTEMEQLGGMVQCVGSREGLLYCVDVLRENTEAALDILAGCFHLSHQDINHPPSNLSRNLPPLSNSYGSNQAIRAAVAVEHCLNY